MKPAAEVLDIARDDLESLLERVRTSLSEEDYRKLKAVVEGLSYLTELIADKDTTIRDLRRLLFPLVTEKTREVLEQAGIGEAQKPVAAGAIANKEEKKPGHGRNGADAYGGAKRVEIAHAKLATGDRCPGCEKGRVYEQQYPRVLVRIVGQAPLAATVYELQRLRCNLCGEIYTAEAPEGVGEEKYEDTAAAMIAQLKYGSGMPFYRLEHLEESLGIPLPAATQWEIVEEAAELMRPAYEELIRQAAQGGVLHNDDTSMRVLHLAREPAEERTGVFTSGIVSLAPGWKVALFFSGAKHAGENLAEVLKRRAPGLGAPIQVGRAGAEYTEARRRGRAAGGQLSGARQTAVRGSGDELRRGMPSCAGVAGCGVPQRCAGARTEDVAGRTVALPSGTQPPHHGQTAWLDGSAVKRP
jgi:transposase